MVEGRHELHSPRKVVLGGVITALAGIALGAGAWACVSGPALILSSDKAKPGDVVQVTADGFRAKNDPIVLRFNALDGPVLATLGEPNATFRVEGSFAVPEGTKPGNYVIIGVQQAPDGKLTQQPVRALLSVVGPDGTRPALGAALNPAEPRPAGLVEADESISGAALALVALGVGGLGLFLVGAAALVAGTRGRRPAPEVAGAQK